MGTERSAMTGLAMLVAACGLGGLLGCGDVNEPGPDTDVSQVQSEFRRHHRPPGPGNQGSGGSTGAGGTASGGSTGGGITSDCSICDRAARCCSAVTSGPLCNVSSGTCEAVAPASRAPYVNACLTLLNAVIGANLSAVPAACGK